MSPAKAQISLGIRPKSLLCTQWVAWDPSFLHADAKTDQTGQISLRWVHMPFCWFCREVAHMFRSNFRMITAEFSEIFQIFSSPEPKAQWWVYRIGRPLACVYMCVNIFKHVLLWNHWADWSQISCGASLGWGNESLLKKSPGHMTKMATMPIYGKNLKKIIFSWTKRQMTLKFGM